MTELDRRKFNSALTMMAALPSLLAARGANAAEAVGVTNRETVNVTDPRFGAKGDGKTDDTAALQKAINVCFGEAGNPHNGNARLNAPLYFPAGLYVISAPLVFPPLRGGHIYGAGRMATTIINGSGSSVFVFDGCEYSRIEALMLEASGEARVIDFNWDGSSGPGGANLQSNTFYDLFIKNGGYGVDIGRGNFMGSENIFLNCFFEGQTVAGLKTSNFNALQNQVVGGNFQSCNIAIWVESGSVTSVLSVGFQRSRDVDVRIDNAAKDQMQLIGCRTESENFVRINRNPVFVTMLGCLQSSLKDGVFIDSGDSQAVLIGCASTKGVAQATGPKLVITQCQFNRNPWYNFAHFGPNSFVEINHVRFGSDDRDVPPQQFIDRRRIVAAGVFDGDAPHYREAATSEVEIGAADEIVGINNRLGVPVVVKLGHAEARNGKPVTIKDVSGTAAVSSIMPRFSDGERCDGKPDADFVIKTAFGSATFYPRAGGWYRLS